MAERTLLLAMPTHVPCGSVRLDAGPPSTANLSLIYSKSKKFGRCNIQHGEGLAGSWRAFSDTGSPVAFGAPLSSNI